MIWLYLLFITLLCNVIDNSQLHPDTCWGENCSIWLMWAFALCLWLHYRCLDLSRNLLHVSSIWHFLSSSGFCKNRHSTALQYFLSIYMPWLKTGCMRVDYDVMPRSTDAAQENRRKLTEFHPLNPLTFFSLGDSWHCRCLQNITWKCSFGCLPGKGYFKMSSHIWPQIIKSKSKYTLTTKIRVPGKKY